MKGAMSADVNRTDSGQSHRDAEGIQAVKPIEGFQPKGTLQSAAHRGLRNLLVRFGDPPVALKLWNGLTVSAHQQTIGEVYIADRATLWRLVVDPSFEFAEGFVDGRIRIDGDLAMLLTHIYRCVIQARPKPAWWQRLIDRIHLPRPNSARTARRNIYHHYDIGNDFYRLWLDERMLYTCAYYERPELSLEQAQIAKMDHVCRKVGLRPGQEVVEAGCGWGGLALHMARHYGVTVRAYNLSQRQIAFARKRAVQERLSDRVEFIEDDWRKISGKCDVFVSIGMLEHVGLKSYRQLGEVINSCLNSDGMGLIHTIGRNYPQPFAPWMEQRIFPGAYPPSLSEMAVIFEPQDFCILDVENLRLHYAETLRHWLARFDRSASIVRRQFGEQFERMWRFYLCSSVAAFECGSFQLFQVLFNRSTGNRVPRTRADWYCDVLNANRLSDNYFEQS